MKKQTFLLVMIFLVLSCKNGNKKTAEDDTLNQEPKEVVEDTPKEEVVLPPNTIQLNEEQMDYPEENFTLTKIQVEETSENNFLLKLFYKTELPELFKNGDYLLFVQNYPFENSIEMLDEKSMERGFQVLYSNLNTSKPYKDEFVVFRSFKSEIYDFEKIVIGVRDNVNNRDIFREQFDFASIID